MSFNLIYWCYIYYSMFMSWIRRVSDSKGCTVYISGWLNDTVCIYVCAFFGSFFDCVSMWKCYFVKMYNIIKYKSLVSLLCPIWQLQCLHLWWFTPKECIICNGCYWVKLSIHASSISSSHGPLLEEEKWHNYPMAWGILLTCNSNLGSVPTEAQCYQQGWWLAELGSVG